MGSGRVLNGALPEQEGVENLAENFPRGTLQALFSLRTLEELKWRAAQSTHNPQTLRLSPT